MKKMMTNLFTTLTEAVKWTEKQREEKGCICPCCSQVVKTYNYKFYATSAVALIKLYLLDKASTELDFHIKDFAESDGKMPRAAHFADLRWWGLVSPSSIETEGKKSSGYWRITEEGKKFVKKELSVREKIKIFNNSFYGYEGGEVNIGDVLKNKFDYYELMNS